MAVHDIGAASAFFDAHAVAGVLIHIRVKDEVAVFIPSGIVGKVAVFIQPKVSEHAGLGNFEKEFVPLLKEGARKIKIAPIIPEIPFITPPVFLFVDLEGFVRRNIRNHHLIGGIAFASVEFAHVLLTESTTTTFIGTKCGSRESHFFVERFIKVGDCEIFSGSRTGFGSH